MQSGIQPAYTWSRESVFSGKPHTNILLVEWRGLVQPAVGRKKTYKLAARDVELRIWPEPHVTLTGLAGCKADVSGERALVLRLGSVRAGQRKCIALEFWMDSREPGEHQALWLQWRYSIRAGERARELPMQKLSLHYTRHTGSLSRPASFYVEKHMEILRTEEIMDKAGRLYAAGRKNGAKELLRRHGDKLLLLAVRSGDLELMREAEALYLRSERELFSERMENGRFKSIY